MYSSASIRVVVVGDETGHCGLVDYGRPIDLKFNFASDTPSH